METQKKYINIFQAMNNIYFSHFCIDLTNNTYTVLQAAPWLNDIPDEGKYTELVRILIKHTTMDSYRAMLSTQLSIDNIKNAFQPGTRGPQSFYMDYPVMQNGKERWTRFTMALVDFAEDGTPGSVLGLLQDVTADKEEAMKDDLTGVYNRKYGERMINEMIRYANFQSGLFILADIDHFNRVNDHFSHQKGDEILVSWAKNIVQTFPRDTIVCRLGGDDFIIFVTRTDDTVKRKLEELKVTVHNKLSRGNYFTTISGSFGVVEVPKFGASFEELYLKADQALKLSKQLGGDNISYYEETLPVKEMEEYILDHFEEALQKKYIHIYYQPIIRTISGNLCGMEALARWADPEMGILYPEDFIPILEAKRKIHRLDLYMLEEVCRKMSDAMSKGEVLIPISVNLSRYDFLACDVSKEVENLVNEYDIARDLLNVEITESLTMDDPDLVKKEIDKFQQNGYQILLDDFGNGRSSFDVLKRFAFNQIKLDIATLSEFDSTSKNIIISLVSLARKLNIHTIAEGVETKEQFEFLRSIGCEKAQGYYLGEPLPFRKSLANCKKQQRGIEGRGWRSYYDRLAGIDFMADSPLAIVEFDGENSNYLYANESFQEVWNGVGLTNMSMVYDAVNSSTSPLKRIFSDFQKKLIVGGEFQSIDFTVNGHYMRLRAKSLCEYLGQTLVHMEISNLTQKSVMAEKKNDDLSLRMLYATYETVLRMDLDTGKIELLVTGAQLQLPEIKTLETLKMGEARLFAVDHFIHKQDRNEYLEWINTEKAMRRIQEQEKGYITKYFRTKIGNGDYVWQEHQMLYVPGEDCIIYSTKRAPFTERLIERVSPKHLIQNMDSMDDVLWKQLMKSKSINLFWKDKDRRFLGANQKFLDTYGFDSVNEILGKTDEDMQWHINDIPFQNDELDVINKGIIIINRMGKCIVKGVSHDILVTKEPLYKDGKIVGLLGYFILADDLIESDQNAHSFKLIDPASGLLSSSSLFGAVLDYAECWETKQEDFALIRVNIKQFKREADTYGERIATSLLRKVGATIKRVIATRATGAKLYGGLFIICMKCRKDGDIGKLTRDLERQIMMIHDADGFPVTLYPEIDVHYASEAKDTKELLMNIISQ